MAREKRLVGVMAIAAIMLFATIVGGKDVSADTGSQKMSPKAQIKQMVVQGARNYQRKVDISNYNLPLDSAYIDNLGGTIEVEYPDLWYLHYVEPYTRPYKGIQKTEDAWINYTFGEKEFSEMKAKDKVFRRQIKKLKKKLKRKTKYATIKACYRWVAKNVEYKETYNCRNSYGCIAERKAVCAGFERGLRVLLASYGYKTRDIRSKSMNHAWLQVKYKGKWYHCDPTWDREKKGKVTYTYFMKGSKKIKKLEHYGWKVVKKEY